MTLTEQTERMINEIEKDMIIAKLLEALKYIVNWNNHNWNVETARNLANTAIAKAEGINEPSPLPNSR